MPMPDRTMHARFAVKWIFKHVLEKKLSVTSQEKNCLFLIREGRKEKNNLIGKKNHTPPPPLLVLNGSPLNDV